MGEATDEGGVATTVAAPSSLHEACSAPLKPALQLALPPQPLLILSQPQGLPHPIVQTTPTTPTTPTATCPTLSDLNHLTPPLPAQTQDKGQGCVASCEPHASLAPGQVPGSSSPLLPAASPPAPMTPQPRRPRARRHGPGLPAKSEADGAVDGAATGAAAGAMKAAGGAADEVSGEGEGKPGPGQQRQMEVGKAAGRPARRVTRSMTVDERAQERQAAVQKDTAKKQEEKEEEEEEEKAEEEEEKKEKQLPPILGSYASVKNMMSTWHCRQVHRAKCWLKALQDMESQLHVEHANGQPPFLQLGTWLLGWTASGYGANIVQPCCACNRECCPVERNARGCPLQLGMSRPILYCPVVATFQLGTYDPRKHPPYKWEYVRMLGVTFACSPACAEAREPARGLSTCSPQAHRTYDPSKVVADPRLLMALTMAQQGGQPVAQFKTFMRYMKREPWAGFPERLSDNLRSLFESAVGEPKKPARAPKKPARAPMKPACAPKKPVSEKPSRPRSAAAGKSGPSRSRKRPAESDTDSDSDSDSE